MDKATREALGDLAAGQGGLFSVTQAKQVGLTNGQLLRAAGAGHLTRGRRGVYAMAGMPPTRWDPIVGAALAAGPEAIISHGSAAAVRRFDYGVGGGVELTVRPGSSVRLPGVCVHRAADLPAEDVIRERGVLVTSRCRTLVDMAGRLGPLLTEKLVDEGLIVRRWTVTQLQECLSRARQNTAGREFLNRLLQVRGQDVHADSVLEAKAFRALAPLRPFEVHFPVVLGTSVYVLDAAWPEWKVGAEIVGRAHRLASLSAFDRERRKLNALSVDGWRICHLTAAMTVQDMVVAVKAMLVEARRVHF
jgi:hypothetical protein